VVLVWLNATSILLASGQDSDIADQVSKKENKRGAREIQEGSSKRGADIIAVALSVASRLSLFAISAVVVLLNATSILVASGQDPAIADLVSKKYRRGAPSAERKQAWSGSKHMCIRSAIIYSCGSGLVEGYEYTASLWPRL
jgi:hypothetical protein